MVHACSQRRVSNVLSYFKENDVRLIPPREVSQDEVIEVQRADDLLDVTPGSLRKAILGSPLRGCEDKRA